MSSKNKPQPELDVSNKEKRAAINLKIKEIEELSMETYSRGWVRGTWESDDIAQEFYAAHRKAWALKEELMKLPFEKHVEADQTAYAIELKERCKLKEVNVTSGTFERASKRLFGEVDGFLCGGRA